MVIVAAIGAALALALPSPDGWAAKGGVTVSDSPGCPGGGNAAKVTVPFSIEATGLPPLSQTSSVFVTDKDARPQVTYGPITIEHVDAQGIACADVFEAAPGLWKIDVVEQGSGFTDSKVLTVEGEAGPSTTVAPPSTSTTTPPPTTTVPATTTTATTGPTTTTSTSTATTTTPSSTTTSSTTTTLPTVSSSTTPVQESTTTTAAEAIHLPGSDLPWVMVFETKAQPGVSTSSHLPRTGADLFAELAVGSALLGAALPLLISGRRRRRDKA